jgi:pimeloyl-ACP methyl ester carboxylesterase
MPLQSIAGGSLFVERFGTGPPRVLALHGWGRRGSDFAAACDGLDALALDLPGFGASPPPRTAVGAAGYAELVAPVFDAFDRPPLVVGHSFGGRVAVAAEACFPKSAAGLLLVACPLVRRPGPRRGPSLAFKAARWANQGGLLSDDRLEQVKRRHGSADYRAATGVMRDVLVTVVNESYEAELARLEVPVSLLWGRDDGEVPVEVAETAAAIIREAGGLVDLEILDGVGHHVPLAAPRALRRAIDTMRRTL